MKKINKMTKEQFERVTQEIKERGISITAWCNENNIKRQFRFILLSGRIRTKN